MNLSLEKVKIQVKDCLHKYYVQVIEGQVDDEVQKMISLVEEAETFCNSSRDEYTNHSEIAKYKTQFNALIDSNYSIPQEKRFSEKYADLIEALRDIFKDLDQKQYREQGKERFYSLQDDPWLTKFFKYCKNVVFHISTTPLRLSNIFKKEKSRIHYWKHTIPYKNLIVRHFLNEVIPALNRVNELVFPMICDLYLKIKIWEVDSTEAVYRKEKEVDKSIQRQIETFKNNLLQKIHITIEEILEARLRAFELDYEKTGTIELSNRNFSGMRTEKQFGEAEKKWNKNYYGWENTAYALFEDWRSDLDIYTLKHKILAEFTAFQSAKSKKLGEHIIPKIAAINEFIQQTSQSLSGHQVSVLKELKRINYLSSKKLDKELVPQLSEDLSSQPVNNLINKLEISIRQAVEELSNEHVIVKTTSFDYPIEAEEIKKISPYELIVFETLTMFEDELSTIKKELFTAFETATVETKDLDHIIIFSTSSAISMIEEQGKSEEEAKSVALKGLQRAENRLRESKDKLEAFLEQKSNLIEKSINKFCSNIMELTLNENVNELRLRIAKAKASKQAKKTIWQLQEKIGVRRNQLLVILRKYYETAHILLVSISNKFILTASKPVLSKQVSDFLMESQQAMDILPIIYKRLYQIEPLQDLELFEGRETEFKSINEAYNNWEKGRFAATVILGEKWGGLTTFINYAIKKGNYPYPVKRFAQKENIYSERKFIDLLNILFENNEFENIDHVIEYLNSGTKKIVIIEDIQNLYLRKVHGFTALQLLFQLTARTYKNVFWVMSTTIYTWQYLTKTINILEYFSYVIEMEELTNEQVISIIWKRNRISGYNIHFAASQLRLEDKKFFKLEKDQQQPMLKKEFFSSLNSFAKSNVSLALIFWLLSTKSIDEDTITIGSFKKPDLGFLDVLSMEKVYILHVLILHDGLTELQLNDVLNTSESAIRLLLIELLQDGVILQKEEVYLVNPLVYRNLIALLKSKNLIH